MRQRLKDTGTAALGGGILLAWIIGIPVVLFLFCSQDNSPDLCPHYEKSAERTFRRAVRFQDQAERYGRGYYHADGGDTEGRALQIDLSVLRENNQTYDCDLDRRLITIESLIDRAYEDMGVRP